MLKPTSTKNTPDTRLVFFDKYNDYFEIFIDMHMFKNIIVNNYLYAYV